MIRLSNLCGRVRAAASALVLAFISAHAIAVSGVALPFDGLPYVRAQIEQNAKVAADKRAEVDAGKERSDAYVAARATETNDPTPYIALFTCSLQGEHTQIIGCFAGSSTRPSTDFELKNGDSYGLYKNFEIENLGRETRAGLEMPLSRGFAITAQNSSDILVLGLKIVNKYTHQVVYQKQVGEFGVIKVSDGDE